MRRWFAISGLCHAGVLVALTAWRPDAVARPPARSLLFECKGLTAPSESELIPEPDPPQPPPRDPVPDSWSVDEVRVETPEPPAVPDDVAREAVELPGRFDPATRRLAVRLARPVRIPRRDAGERTPPAPAPAPVAEPPAPPRRSATRDPVPQGRTAPIEYPRRARRRGLEGSVELKILVTPGGRVERVLVSRSSGHAILDEAARTAVLTWRFEPAVRDGRPVAAWTRRTIHFRLVAGGAEPRQ